jgi:hypothetical protein
MSQTPSYFVNSPSTGLTYYAPSGYYCIPNNGSSITTTIRAWTGPNGTGSLTSVNMTAVNHCASTGIDVNSFTGSGNSVSASTSASVNGSNVFRAAGRLNSGSVGSLEIYIVYTGSAIVPVVSSFSPSVGGPGTSVTITGGNFTGATSVSFNGTSASFTVTDDSHISATVPSGATAGTITVFNPSGSGTSAGSFTPSTLYVDDGSNFQACTVYVDDGSNFQACTVYVDDGSNWIQVA